LADQFSLGALQSPQARRRHQAAIREAAEACEFFFDQRLLLAACTDLGCVRGDVCIQLRPLALKGAGSGFEGSLTRAQFGLLTAQDDIRAGPVLVWQSRPAWRRFDGGAPIQLGHEPRPTRFKLKKLVGSGSMLGRHFGRHEFDQDVAAGHLLPVLNMEPAHNAAVAVLHGLPVAADNNEAGRCHASIEGGASRPASEHTEKEEKDDHSGTDFAAAGIVCLANRSDIFRGRQKAKAAKPRRRRRAR
jgi:hypothetical protein